jgi:hypothetical protein
MPTSALILTAVIIVGVFMSDLGRRTVTRRRLHRPLIIAGIVGATYLAALATSGAGLALELSAAGTGAVLGLLAASFMRVENDPDNGEVFTRAGIAYAAIWIAAATVRLAFIYGSQHWFAGSLDSWMLAHHITAAVLTDALVLEALAMTIARTISLYVRSRPGARGTLGSGIAANSTI